MKISRSRVMNIMLSAGVICLIALFSTYSTSAQQTKAKGKADAKVTANPRISYPGYISGTVTSEKGPEAGVWVIAETNDLQTKMIKTVVTDDQRGGDQSGHRQDSPGSREGLPRRLLAVADGSAAQEHVSGNR